MGMDLLLLELLRQYFFQENDPQFFQFFLQTDSEYNKTSMEKVKFYSFLPRYQGHGTYIVRLVS